MPDELHWFPTLELYKRFEMLYRTLEEEWGAGQIVISLPKDWEPFIGKNGWPYLCGYELVEESRLIIRVEAFSKLMIVRVFNMESTRADYLRQMCAND